MADGDVVTEGEIKSALTAVHSDVAAKAAAAELAATTAAALDATAKAAAAQLAATTAAASDATAKAAAAQAAAVDEVTPSITAAQEAANSAASAATASRDAIVNPKLWSAPLFDKGIRWITTLSTGHDWTVTVSGTSTTEDDTTRPGFGTSSLHVTIPSDGASVFVQNSSLALDMSGGESVVVSRWVSDELSATQLRVYTDASNYWTYVMPGSGPLDRWFIEEVPFERMTVTGTPNKATITRIAITVLNTQPGDYWFGGVGTRPKNTAYPVGALIVGFDDGYEAQFSIGRSVLAEFGFPGTVYTIPELVGTANFCTVDQLRQMQDMNGWCVSCHSASSWASLTESELRAAIEPVQAWLQENGFRGWRHFAAANGQISSTMLDVLPEYLITIRGSSSAALGVACAQRPVPVSWARMVHSMSVNAANIASIPALVQAASDGACMMSIQFHALTSPDPDETALRTLMGEIRDIGIPVVTPIDIYGA